MTKKLWFSSILVCVLFSAPSLVPAQAGPGAGALVPPSQVYGRMLNGQEREIVGAAEAMPAEKYSFVPSGGNFQGVRSFGEQVKHLAESNFMYFGNFGVTPARDPKAIDKLTSKADIVQALKDSYAFARQAINTMTPENAFLDQGPRHGTRAGSAAMSLAHANDHYGQMVEYLRMNGIVPPASR